MRGERGQAAAASVLLVLVMVLIAGAMVDVYRLQEARSWAYRAAEAAALTGVTLGRDLSTVYTHGRPRVDPGVGHDTAEQALLDALARWGATRYAYDIRVAEWGGEVFSATRPWRGPTCGANRPGSRTSQRWGSTWRWTCRHTSWGW